MVTGGTDTHIVLLDCRRQGLKGNEAADRLERAGITSNKNMVPFDVEKPWITSGLRLGSAAATSRGFGPEEFQEIADLIADVLGDPDSKLRGAREQVARLCDNYPLYRT